MKQNIYVIAGAAVIRTLVADPQRSNWDISRGAGVSEAVVRRYRALLELGGVLAVTTSRVGSDGIARSI